jgi:hypothetical protein
MQKEEEFFLQVLADHLNKRKTAVPDNLNWYVLKGIGQNHKLSGIIYHQCKNSIVQSDLPVKVKTKWRQGYLYNVYLYSKRIVSLNQIDTEFKKENIPYLILKGIEVAAFYPVSAQRTMGDIDLLVHPEDKQRACDILCRLGFKMDVSEPVEWKGAKDEIAIELHHRLIYNYYKSVELESFQTWGDKVWEHVIEQEGKIQCKLDLTYHLVYVLLHLRRHFLEAGVGFRQFMDVAVLALRPEINWQQAELWFKELGLEKFSQVCFALCKRWFCVEIPGAEAELQKEFYNDATEKILNNGVFGSIDKEYNENIIFNEARFTKSTGTYSIFKLIFLPYNDMKGKSYCKFLIGRPWLLPVAWCWRCIYLLFSRKNVVSYLKGAYSSETKKKKEEMLSNWGL